MSQHDTLTLEQIARDACKHIDDEWYAQAEQCALNALHTFAEQFSATQPAQAAQPVSRDVIRDVFLRNGFTIKDGCSDLKPYVYAAANALLEVAAAQPVQGVPEDFVRIPRPAFDKAASALRQYSQAPVDYHRSVLRMRDALRELTASPTPPAQQAAQSEPVKPLFAAKIAARKWAELQDAGARMQSIAFDGHKSGHPGTIDPWGVVRWGQQAAQRTDADVGDGMSAAASLREAAQNALVTLDGIADTNPRNTADFETPAEWITWAKSRARWAADALRAPIAQEIHAERILKKMLHDASNEQTEKKCGTCGFIGQEDPVKGCPKCGFDDMRTKAEEHRDGRLAALEEVAALKLALTALLNDPAVIEAAQPGDIGRALCAVRGI